MKEARNAWGEPTPPNPVREIIATRTAQVCLPAALALAALVPFVPRKRLVPLLVSGGVGVSLALSAYFALTFSVRFALPGCPLMTTLPEERGAVVALTFDDGPHPDTTPRLLEALDTANVKATFFLVGERAARYPELARRIAAAGHGIGVHGLRHRTMALLSAAQIEADLREAVSRIEEACGRALPRPLLVRPPYGFKSRTLCRVATREGFTLAAWSLDPRDYDSISAETLVRRVDERLRPGTIVLLHERPEHPIAVEALPRLIERCRVRGLKPMALPPTDAV